MFRFIEQHVNKCHICNEIRPKFERNVDQWPKAGVFQRIHLDWAYIRGECNLLMVVDAGSGWIEAFPLQNRQTSSVISCLRSVFSRFGIPEVVVTDNAPEFLSGDLSNWLENIGSRKIESPIYHPRANGIAERSVQTIKHALLGWRRANTHVPFSEFLKKVLFHHRVSSHSRGISPSEIMFGRRIRCPIFSRFNQGENVTFRPNKDQPTMTSKYIMPKSKSTSWILKDGSLILASDSQLAPMAHPLNQEEEDSREEEINEEQLGSPTNDTVDNHSEDRISNEAEEPSPRDGLRRSARNITFPKRYGFSG